MIYAHVSNLNNLQSEMLKSPGFYKDDIRVMEAKLREVARKNTRFEARQGIEHFENQFILQRNNIGRLRHHINEFVLEVVSDIKAHDGHIKEGLVGKQHKLEEEYEGLEKVINELLHEFNQFLVKWM